MLSRHGILLIFLCLVSTSALFTRSSTTYRRPTYRPLQPPRIYSRTTSGSTITGGGAGGAKSNPVATVIFLVFAAIAITFCVCICCRKRNAQQEEYYQGPPEPYMGHPNHPPPPPPHFNNYNTQNWGPNGPNGPNNGPFPYQNNNFNSY